MGSSYSALSGASATRHQRMVTLKGPHGARFNVLVCGPVHSGKSSFINSWHRVMAQRWGTTSDVCMTGTSGFGSVDCMTKATSRISFPGSHGLGVIDAPHLDFTSFNTLSDATTDVLKKLVQGVPTGFELLGKAADDIPHDPSNKIHAIIMVVDAVKLDSEGNLPYQTQVNNLAKTIRDISPDTPWAVVATHRADVRGSDKEVMAKVNVNTLSSGSTYVIENYVKLGTAVPPRRQETDDTILHIFDEFADYYAARE